MNIAVTYDSDEVRIFFDDVLHCHFWKKFYRGFQAYNNGKYTIDILLKDATLRLEYDDRERWVEVLKVIHEAI